MDSQGKVVRDMPVPLREPIMMHDMALTQNYALLLDVPLVFDGKVIRWGCAPLHWERFSWWLGKPSLRVAGTSGMSQGLSPFAGCLAPAADDPEGHAAVHA
jgi:carotenoid cleavage dioxygenase-like enzyme